MARTPQVVKSNKLTLVFKGQTEGGTKWKGWAWKLFLVKFVNIFCQELQKYIY